MLNIVKISDIKQIVVCDRCHYFLLNSTVYRVVYKYERGKLYCKECISQIKKEPIDSELANQAKFDKVLDACLNTPPLKLKDLKERLKKEKEEKRKRNEISR